MTGPQSPHPHWMSTEVDGRRFSVPEGPLRKPSETNVFALVLIYEALPEPLQPVPSAPYSTNGPTGPAHLPTGMARTSGAPSAPPSLFTPERRLSKDPT